MGLAILVASLCFLVSGEQKTHSFGFDGNLVFFNEFLTELFKTYTGAENVDLSRCLTQQFLDKFEGNLVSTLNQLTHFNLDEGLLGMYVIIDDIVRVSNVCDAGFSIPTTIIYDKAGQIEFYTNMIVNGYSALELITKSYDNLSIGHFKAAGHDFGSYLKLLFPLEEEKLMSNEKYVDWAKGFMSEVINDSTISTCSNTINQSYEAALKVFEQGFELAGGNFMAIANLLSEANTLLKNLKSLNVDCGIESGYNTLTYLLSYDGMKNSVYRYYLNKKIIYENFEELKRETSNSFDIGKSSGKLLKLVLGLDNLYAQDISQEVFIKVIYGALEEHGDNCPDLLKSKLETFKKINEEGTQRLIQLDKAYSKIKSKFMNYINKYGIIPLLATPGQIQEIMKELRAPPKREDL